MKRRIIFLILNFIAAFASAQINELKFNLVEGPNGKPLGDIHNIGQDPHGTIWFIGAGEHSLYRYDGNRLTVYRRDPGNENSLGLTDVQSMYADSRGYIWIGGNGLDQFNPATGKFKHFKHSENDPQSLAANGVDAILEDSKGRVWIGTFAGLDRYDEKTESFIHYKHDPANPRSLSHNRVRSIYEDRKGTIWVGTGFPFFSEDDKGGLNRFNEDGTFTQFVHDPNDPHTLANNKVRAIYEDSRGVFWVGTSKEIGLHTMDRETGKFTRHPFNPADPNQLSRPLIKSAQENQFVHDNDMISSIIEDVAGEIWISTLWSGINRFDPFTKKITHYDSTFGFPAHGGWEAFNSKDGVLWIAPLEGGLYRVDPFHKTPTRTETGSNKVPHFLEDKDGFLWVATGGDGIFQYDQYKRLIRQYKHDPSDRNSISNDFAHALYTDGGDSIWIATDKGVEIFNKHTSKFSRLSVNAQLKDSVFGPVISIIQDRKGAMWFSTWGKGLFRYDKDDHAIKRYLPDKMDSAAIASNMVSNVLEDRFGDIWATTSEGVARLDALSGKFKHYLKNKETKFLCLYEDREGTLWVGAGDGGKGLYRYDRQEDELLAVYDPLSDLNQQRVYRITEDGLNNLWVNTGTKLIRVDKATKQTFVYGRKFGIGVSEDLHFGGLYNTRGGQLLVGYEGGFFSLQPQQWIKANPDVRLNITDAFINNIRLVSGDESPIKTRIEEVTDLVLSHNQNNLFFDFAANDYREPETTRYYTMLENYDNQWREAQREKSASYFVVPPGSYTFRVKAYISDGSIVEKNISILINPPWWKTWWAYSFYGLCVIGLLYTSRGEIIRRERLHATLKLEHLELEKAKDADKLRSSLFANISHEFRTPLTLIKGHADDMLEEYSSYPKTKERLKLIRSNSDLLLKLINQMLELARLESGNVSINKSETELNFFLRAMTGSFSSMAAQKKIEITTHLSSTQYIALFDNDKLETILINLLNNAIKFTPSGGKIEFTLSIASIEQAGSRNSAVLTIDVKDTGIGISPDQQSKIFERFYQISEAHKEVGTGIGLSLVKELAELLQGSITVQSELGHGSVFTLKLPLEIVREVGNADIVNHVESQLITLQNGSAVKVESNGTHERPKLLVVEDNADLVKFIISSLGTNYEFLEAADGKQGLELALNEIPELIISDVMMPEMDGIQMTSRLKKDLRTSHIPVIILTAKAADESKIEGLNSGATDYLTKPFNKKELVLKVKNAIEGQEKIRNKIRLELLREGPKFEVVSEEEKLLARVKETVLSRLSDEQLSVESLVEEIGMSRAQFYRKITAITGMSVNDLIRSFRLQKAAQLLAQHWGPVTQVAYEVGFSNLSHFSKCFKEQFGVLPSEYRSKVTQPKI